MNNKKPLTKIFRAAALTSTTVFLISGCSGSGEDLESADPGVIGGEHEREGDERSSKHSGEKIGEESGAEFALDETYDMVRNGPRMILAYDAQSNSFSGTVENATDSTLRRVRVEVQLSNGTELGPTIPTDRESGGMMNVKLPATSETLIGWTAHPEAAGREGGSEHRDEGNGDHKGEGKGEHDGEGSREIGSGG